MTMSTKQVAEVLGISIGQIQRKIFLSQVKTPDEKFGNAYMWGFKEIDQTCRIIRGCGILQFIKDRPTLMINLRRMILKMAYFTKPEIQKQYINQDDYAATMLREWGGQPAESA